MPAPRDWSQTAVCFFSSSPNYLCLCPGSAMVQFISCRWFLRMLYFFLFPWTCLCCSLSELSSWQRQLVVLQNLFSPSSLGPEPLNISWSSGIGFISQPPLHLELAILLSFGQWDINGSVVHLSLFLPIAWNVSMMAELWAAILDHEVEASAEKV